MVNSSRNHHLTYSPVDMYSGPEDFLLSLRKVSKSPFNILLSRLLFLDELTNIDRPDTSRNHHSTYSSVDF